MAKKTPIDKLAQSINKVLKEYEDSVVKDTGELTKKFAQKGAQAVRNEAQSHGWGEHTGYDKGWTSRFETGRLSSQGIIYNQKVPGLAHLLENGHAKRNGGRVAGVAHIAPVEEKIAEEFYKAVKESL